MLLLGLVLSFAGVSGAHRPEVRISDGVLRGKYMETKNGRMFSGFMGIPFAKPPVGELRFRPPVPVDPWKGVLNAGDVHVVCPQRDVYRRTSKIEGEEDCLYLNVYTPKLSDFEKQPLPVMIFFHGGGWLCGGGNSLWYGPELLLDRDIVLVVTNYRLGALGFLTTGDDVVSGNNGLKDQNLALKWIKNHIKHFGGDPDKVTMFGESAGGASSHFHMLSPLSKDLFKGAILQSGTAFGTWTLWTRNEGVDNSKKLASLFNCPVDSSKEMVECLRKINAYALVAKDEEFILWDYDPMIPFKPVIEPNIEGAFLTAHPMDLIYSGHYTKIPIIVGLNTEDGSLKIAGIHQNLHLLQEFDEKFDQLAPMSLEYDKLIEDVVLVTKNLRKFYFGNARIDRSNLRELINLYTDGWFLDGADTAVRTHVKYTNQPVYYYLFGYRGSSSLTKIFGGGDADLGVCHADELQYLFPIGDGLFSDVPPSEEDKKITTLMTTLWANFAWTGNPTPDSGAWKEYTLEHEEYYYIDKNSSATRLYLWPERSKLWRSFPKLYQKKNVKLEL